MSKNTASAPVAGALGGYEPKWIFNESAFAHCLLALDDDPLESAMASLVFIKLGEWDSGSG
jgi:hypothetical protein